MQKESLIEKKERVLNLDLDTKKEVAKIGMAASLGVVTATSFYLKSSLMKNLHLGSGVALIGFSFWHHMLYQSDKKERASKKLKNIQNKEKIESSIKIEKVYTELRVDGKLESEDIKSFEVKLESLMQEHGVSSIDTLVDIRGMSGISLMAMWDDLVFYLKNIKTIDRVAVVGNKKLGKFSSVIAEKIRPQSMNYFDNYEDAKKWIH